MYQPPQFKPLTPKEIEAINKAESQTIYEVCKQENPVNGNEFYTADSRFFKLPLLKDCNNNKNFFHYLFLSKNEDGIEELFKKFLKEYSESHKENEYKEFFLKLAEKDNYEKTPIDYLFEKGSKGLKIFILKETEKHSYMAKISGVFQKHFDELSKLENRTEEQNRIFLLLEIVAW